MGSAGEDDGGDGIGVCVLLHVAPAEQVEVRFFSVAALQSLNDFQRQQDVRFHASLDHKGGAGVTLQTENAVGLWGTTFFRHFVLFLRRERIDLFELIIILFPVPFNGHKPSCPGLQVGMVGSRRAAACTVVEEKE